MNTSFRTPLCLLAAFILLFACRLSDEQEIMERSADFARAYFNLRFDDAAALCVPESMPWIDFRASNITLSDTEAFNALPHEAQVSVSHVEWLCDTLVQTFCTVNGFISADSIEQTAGHVVPQQTFRIPLVKRNGMWLIKMEAPLQSAE